MSKQIVPKEIVIQWVSDWYALPAFRPAFSEYIANRAAEWTFEQAASLCEARYMGDLSREDQETKACAQAIRAKYEQEKWA